MLHDDKDCPGASVNILIEAGFVSAFINFHQQLMKRATLVCNGPVTLA